MTECKLGEQKDADRRSEINKKLSIIVDRNEFVITIMCSVTYYNLFSMNGINSTVTRRVISPTVNIIYGQVR